MSPLQIWNYLGLGCVRKKSFFGLGGLKIILTKFFTVYWILVWHFGTVWSRKIKICYKVFKNISSNIYSLTLPKRPISKINLCYCFFNQWESLNFRISLLTYPWVPKMRIIARFVKNVITLWNINLLYLWLSEF